MSLHQIPPELVEHIASLCDAITLGSLRLTCHELLNRTSHEFAACVLNQQWLMQEDSLLELGKSTRDERFSDKLATLRLGTHAFYDFEWLEPDKSDKEPEWNGVPFSALG